ncbi:MAG: hypothetical protein LBP32_03335, partial [Spirochaetaceae bacterium]|nr:hypothetical protein [Spirochaetaceae bacterium]
MISMFIKKLRLTTDVVFLSIVLINCGELDTVLPSSGTYRVNAHINNNTLDECSVIGRDDTIRPYFANSVSNDPDLTGLSVFFQTPQGETVGEKIRYVLSTNSAYQEKSPSGEKAELLIPVEYLDRELPPLPLPQDLKIGRYILVFQVLGQGEILYRTDRAVYFLGDANLNLEDIQSYLPDDAVSLVPPGGTVMLEALVSSDERLSPYVIWYNGKETIGEGAVDEGTHRFLWDAPHKTGFHTIRAEVFPFKPGEELREITGKSRELSLPVSAKQENTGFFARKAASFTHWYQFRGNLRDSKYPDRNLMENKKPRWAPHGGIYGAVIGPGDVYTLPQALFEGAEEGRGQILFRFAPLAAGTLFGGSFTISPGQTLNMNLSVNETGLKLTFSSQTEFREDVVPLDSFHARGFITAVIDFQYTKNSFTAGLGLGEMPAAEGQTLKLSNYINGEGIFTLGGGQGPFDGGVSGAPDLAVAIIDEAAAVFTP